MNTLGSTPATKYDKGYEEAEMLFDEGKLDKSIQRARDNLVDKTCPSSYIIKNCVLIASALDDWDDANVWRLAAEQTYVKALAEAERKKDKESQAVLAELRMELDELSDLRLEDLSGLSREDLNKIVGNDQGIGRRILEEALAQLNIEDNDSKGK